MGWLRFCQEFAGLQLCVRMGLSLPAILGYWLFFLVFAGQPWLAGVARQQTTLTLLAVCVLTENKLMPFLTNCQGDEEWNTTFTLLFCLDLAVHWAFSGLIALAVSDEAALPCFMTDLGSSL